MFNFFNFFILFIKQIEETILIQRFYKNLTICLCDKIKNLININNYETYLSNIEYKKCIFVFMRININVLLKRRK